MSFKDLFDILPQLLNLFIPGFIFLIIYKYFVESQEKDFNVTAISSVVFSYIFQLLAAFICKVFNGPDTICTAIAIVLAVICALVVVKLRLTSFYKNIISSIGRTTGSKSIWYELFNLNKGTRIRFFTKYNHEHAIVEGNVKYFEPYDDGECNIVISNYQITYIINNNVYKNDNPNATIIFNSKNIHGLEAHHGK